MRVILKGHWIFRTGFRTQCPPRESFCARRCSVPTVAAVRIQPRRPTLDDVHRLSEGRAAKSRGFGSRQIPHRLNAEERAAYNIAQQKGFLTLKGSGYRRERKGSPLANIFRQLNDAMNRPCIIVMQQYGGNGGDIVLVDFSPLRLLDISRHEETAKGVAEGFSAALLEHGELMSPFTVIVPEEILDEKVPLVCQAVEDSKEDRSMLTDFEGEIQSRDCKGIANQKDIDSAVEHIMYAPIWQQPPRLLGYSCDRPTSKALSKALIDCFVQNFNLN